MTLARARVIKANAVVTPAPRTVAAEGGRARRIAADVLSARDEAQRLIAEARGEAVRIVAEARRTVALEVENAATEARSEEVARLASAFLAVRDEDARRPERERERLIEMATLLAERLVGEALAVDPARITKLASAALEEARGAKRVRIDVSPEDAPALAAALGDVAGSTDVREDATLGRGSLVVHTDLGRVDARLTPQLERLASALREASR